MNRIFIFLFTLVLASGVFMQTANAQVTVSGSNTKDGTYTSLTKTGGAFAALNLVSQVGYTITISITADVTTEDGTNALTGAAGMWTSLTITPSGNRTISGGVALPLIDLSRADYVTINGIGLTGINTLTISNTSISTTAGTSTIRFINGATNNTVQYCTIKGSEMVAGSGVILFSTTTAALGGNNNNTIDHNNITCAADANRPLNAIYSLGTASYENVTNTISNNNIYNFLNKTAASNGIFLSSYTSAWTISDNNFYETASFTATGTGAYVIINVSNSTGVNFTVSGNYIGGSAADHSGTWTKTGSYGTFQGISVTAGTASASNIQGNTVSKFNWSNTGNTQWYGIVVNTGNFNIGTTSPNTIGAATGTGSIIVNLIHYSYASPTYVIGIQTGGNIVNCNNNIIGSITATHSDAICAGITGIYINSTTTTTSNNTIGSTTTANSINATSISNSTVQEVNGIVRTTNGGACTISGNTIANLSNGTTNTAGILAGINYSGSTTTASTVSGNFIRSLSATGSVTTAGVYGIKIVASTAITTYSNNIISIGENTPSTIYGIYQTGNGGINNLYFNTVYIGGTLGSGTNQSYALYNALASATRKFRNNIFYNARSTTGASSSLHYGMYYVTVGGTLTCDYNDYYVTGTGGVIGFYSVDKTTLPIVTLTGADFYSKNVNPGFASVGGITPSDYTPSNLTLSGASGTGITVDYNNTARTYFSMGAFDYAVNSNITVTATSGTLNGHAMTLKDVFDAINAGIYKGDIAIKISGSTTESATAALYQSGYTGGGGTSSYTSVNIYPTTTGLSISGNLAYPLIDLNGADNVTIDGRVNATGSTKDLTITNTSISSNAGTSTIRFINDATSNTVKFCKIKGSTTVTCNGTNSGSGIIFFSTAASVGNNSNTIDNNEITNAADVSRPLCAIFSLGSDTYINTTNTISNNNIYDFLNRGVASHGIFLGNNTTAWTVSGNNFYETASFIPTATIIYNVIYIVNTGVNYSISNNYIGGAAADHSGIWTKTNAFNNMFYGIYVNAGTSTASNIQGNTINNISWSNSSNSLFCGIGVWGGNVNVGTSSGNTIGAATGTGTLTFTGGANTTFYGIYLNSTSTVNASNNTVGSITTSNAATSGTNTYGIYTASSGTFTINSNLIGSTSTANSINASSASSGYAQSVYGINNSGTGACSISGNIIANLTNCSTASGLLNSTCGINVTTGTTFTISNNIIHDITASDAATGTSVAGIFFNQTDAYAQTVSGNSIYNLKNTNASFAGSVYGLGFAGGSTGSTISGNFIHDLSVTGASSTSGSIYGIKITTGVATYFNNIISLGGNTKTNIYGIYDPGTANNNTNLYFNTVYISGTLASGSTAQSYALKCNDNNSNRNYRNNILVNTRSTSGGSNLHAAIGFMATYGTLTCDYNDYIASGTGGFLGYYIGYVTAVPIVTGQDAHSLNTTPSFASAGGSTALSYLPSATLAGIDGTGITTDYAGSTRAATPTMGAFELPPSAVNWTGTTNTDWNTPGNWSPANVPFTTTAVTIPNVTNDPVVNQAPGTPAICNNLTIASGAVLTIAPGKALTVNGTLTNNAGNTGLVINIGGSLIESSTGISATVNSAIPASEWHLISAPIVDATSAVFTGRYLQTHNEGSNAYTDITPTSDALTPVKGYAVYGDDGFTASYAGALNTGNQSYSTTAATYSSPNGGWNLVGNPYPCSIDWSAFSGWTKTNINNAIYVHRNSSTWATFIGGVGANSGTQYIAPGQGFFIQATAAGTLAMTNAVKVHNATTFFKNADEVVPNLLRIEVSGNGYKDEAVVRFAAEATAEFDGNYDAHKLYGDVAEAAQVYTLGSIPLAINSLPATSTVPLGIYTGAAGTYTLTATEINDLTGVTLEDTHTGIFTDLTKSPCSVELTAGESGQRFVLHFGPLSIEDKESTPASIYSYRHTAYISMNGNTTGDIFIYTISGQLVATLTSASGMNEVQLPVSGTYIVKVVGDKTMGVKKVFIN